MIAHKAQFLFGKAYLIFVFSHIGRTGRINEAPAGSQQMRGMAQQALLQAGEAVQFVPLPEFEHLRVLFGRAPAGAGRVKQDGVPRTGVQGQGVAAVEAGSRLDQIALVQVGAQRAEARGRGFVAQHKACAPHKLRQKARFAAGACAHVQHRGPHSRGQSHGRQHGRTVLDVNIAKKGRQRTAQRARFGQQTAAQGRKRLRLECVPLGAQQGLHGCGMPILTNNTE